MQAGSQRVGLSVAHPGFLALAVAIGRVFHLRFCSSPAKAQNACSKSACGRTGKRTAQVPENEYFRFVLSGNYARFRGSAYSVVLSGPKLSSAGFRCRTPIASFPDRP